MESRRRDAPLAMERCVSRPGNAPIDAMTKNGRLSRKFTPEKDLTQRLFGLAPFCKFIELSLVPAV